METENIVKLKSFISDELLKRGINVSLNWDKNKFISSDFFTTPVLTKRNYIVAEIFVDENEENVTSIIGVIVSVKYEFFCGGTNGHILFEMNCGLDKVRNILWVEKIL